MRQSDHQGIKAEKKAVADAPETDAELEEADEIAEIKRRAAAEVEAEKEKAKVNKYRLSFTRCMASPGGMIGVERESLEDSARRAPLVFCSPLLLLLLLHIACDTSTQLAATCSSAPAMPLPEFHGNIRIDLMLPRSKYSRTPPPPFTYVLFRRTRRRRTQSLQRRLRQGLHLGSAPRKWPLQPGGTYRRWVTTIIHCP